MEKKEGIAHLGDRELTVVDLPGIYSLSPYSMEEIVARDFIIGEGPDAIIDIVDATNWSATSTSPFSSWSWSAPWCWL